MKSCGVYKEKILQFGEGNFLRGFTDWMINDINEKDEYEGSIVLCQPIGNFPQICEMINAQKGKYHLAMRGIENGEVIEKVVQITSISRCINAYEHFEELMKIARSEDLEVVISNTTEAGIVYHEGDQLLDKPPHSFPAKITVLLYERYKAFDGALDKGLLFLPVELIDNNGTELKKVVIRYATEWHLEESFIQWIECANKFTNTLVDRIVTGFPKDEIEYFEEKLGYRDQLIVTSEIFNLWVIEGKKEWAEILPIHKGQGNVIWTDDVTPYKKQKVSILNGGHTGTVLAAYLAGYDIVLDFMKDNTFKKYLNQLLFKEVIPTLTLPQEELKQFAYDVCNRFANPYIKHSLLDISLNSCAKFNTRCLPTLLEYVRKMNTLPPTIVFALAAFIKFYQCEQVDDKFIGRRKDGMTYEVRDEQEVLKFFEEVWKAQHVKEVVEKVLSNKEFWGGEDLTNITGLVDMTTQYLKDLEEKDVTDVILTILN
ncbi:tagaturonate reductase [Niameybacter massiliensis]|uniref:Tagaturonate reductase n=1 Tax=Holtiella tumoricola TaxID=3018743 RepID=A0AA42DPI8_9FIRM|nr:tagaturonate reductase [Holtiella tumoricola]MDA3732730.1 tagaturonate reductase [Holtiella tumoricola]